MAPGDPPRHDNGCSVFTGTYCNCSMSVNAELTRLRAEVARLREALTPFAQPGLMKSHPGAMRNDSAIYGRDNATLRLGDFRRARAALFPAPATDPQGVDRG